jgi:16S rRNA (adenine1518-N6/adenine1519-N6)-dimethyltransferase
MRHVARKRFGQHFLVDRGVMDAIVRAIAPRREELVVEIGPGLGALTGPLIAAKLAASASGVFRPLEAVEFDRDLVPRLKARFPPDRLVVHQADALEFDFARLLSKRESLRIVGNLPYNISSPLLFHLLDVAERVRDQHFMLQKEVALRMVAAPGGPEYGRLSVMLQLRYAMELLFEVPPEAFEPPPKVKSAVVRMIPRPKAALADPAAFAKIVSLAFSQRRKMLRNTLEDYAPQLRAAGIAPTARAEEVSVAEYVRLANLIANFVTDAAADGGKMESAGSSK